MIGSVFFAAVVIATSPALLLMLLAGALAVGYGLGRWRPWDRLDTWVWRRVAFGGDWAKSRTQRTLTFWVHVLVRPIQSLHAWRHRHDPPTPRSPAVKISHVDPEARP